MDRVPADGAAPQQIWATTKPRHRGHGHFTRYVQARLAVRSPLLRDGADNDFLPVFTQLDAITVKADQGQEGWPEPSKSTGCATGRSREPWHIIPELDAIAENLSNANSRTARPAIRGSGCFYRRRTRGNRLLGRRNHSHEIRNATAELRVGVTAGNGFLGTMNPQTSSESFGSPFRLCRQWRYDGPSTRGIQHDTRIRCSFKFQVHAPEGSPGDGDRSGIALHSNSRQPTGGTVTGYSRTRENIHERHKRRFPEERLRSVDRHGDCAPE